MKLNDHFDIAPWLSEKERKLAEALFRKIRRYALSKKAERSPVLDIEVADFVLQWIFLQRMRAAVVLSATPGEAPKGGVTVNAALLEALDKHRDKFLAERKAIEDLLSPQPDGGEEDPLPDTRAGKAPWPPYEQEKKGPMLVIGGQELYYPQYADTTEWQPGMPENLKPYFAEIQRKIALEAAAAQDAALPPAERETPHDGEALPADQVMSDGETTPDAPTMPNGETPLEPALEATPATADNSAQPKPAAAPPKAASVQPKHASAPPAKAAPAPEFKSRIIPWVPPSQRRKAEEDSAGT